MVQTPLDAGTSAALAIARPRGGVRVSTRSRPGWRKTSRGGTHVTGATSAAAEVNSAANCWCRSRVARRIVIGGNAVKTILPRVMWFAVAAVAAYAQEQAPPGSLVSIYENN